MEETWLHIDYDEEETRLGVWGLLPKLTELYQAKMGIVNPLMPVRIGNPSLGFLYLVRYLDAHLGPVGPYFRSIMSMWVQVVH